MYSGSGVHHIGVGVDDYNTMKSFYQDTLGFENVWEEFLGVESPMEDVFRGSSHRFDGIMLGQPAGGIIVELIRMIEPRPRPIRNLSRYGDIGVNKLTVAVSDTELFFRQAAKTINFCTEPQTITVQGMGTCSFVYARDPEGNLLEFISGDALPVHERPCCCRLGVGVTDLERSVSFYRKHVGFDSVIVDINEQYSGLVDGISGFSGTQVRCCVLANEKGGGMLELCELLAPRGRSIPFNAHWGDFGCIELAVECDDLHALARYYDEQEVEWLHRPCRAFDTAEAELWFMYIRDPDGIPVEIVSAIPKI